MEHAPRGIASLAATLTPADRTILILCGPGNNGGDGYGAARFLRSWGRDVRVLRCARRAPSGGDAAWEAAQAEAEVRVEDAWRRPEALEEALGSLPGLIVDALFGVGLTAVRPLQEPYLAWIDAVNASAAHRLCVDVPSGLDADAGTACPGAVRGDVTATMAAPKCGFAHAAALCGRVVEVDIGLPRALHAAYLR